MKILMTAAFLWRASLAFSQDTVACYYDRNWDETKIKDSVMYFRVGERLSSGEWYGKVKDYYKSGKLQMVAQFRNDKKEGPARFYCESGRLSSEGIYKNNSKSGPWTSYYENGYKESEGTYTEGYKTGLWKDYYMNGSLKWEIKRTPVEGKKFTFTETMVTFSDSLGHVTVKEGNGSYRYYDKENDFTEEGSFLNGEKNGVWTGFSQNETTAYTERYDNGKLVEGKSTDSDGKKYTYTELQSTSEYKGGMQQLALFMQKNIRYPKKARKKNIQGKVYIEFIVDTEGAVTNVNVKRGVDEELDEEALRVVRSMPDWVPATNRGKKVRQRYVLPVNFKITD